MLVSWMKQRTVLLNVTIGGNGAMCTQNLSCLFPVSYSCMWLYSNLSNCFNWKWHCQECRGQKKNTLLKDGLFATGPPSATSLSFICSSNVGVGWVSKIWRSTVTVKHQLKHETKLHNRHVAGGNWDQDAEAETVSTNMFCSHLQDFS